MGGLDRRWALQCVGAALAFVALMAVALNPLGERALVALQVWQRAAVTVLGADFEVLRFGSARVHPERVLELVVTTRRHVVVGDRVLSPDPRGTARSSTLQLQGLQGASMALLFVMLWPLSDRRPLAQAFARGVLVVPFALALVVLDAPVVLLASVWDLVYQHLAPGGSNGLMLARDLLRGGGRLAAGALVGSVAVFAANRLGADRSVLDGVSARSAG